MKLSDLMPSVFTDGDDPEVQITTKKYSQFPKVEGDGIQGVGLKDGQNVRFDLTTDAIKVNPIVSRGPNGELIGTPEELDGLENQRDVNNFFYKAINDIEAGDIDLDGYATEEWVEDKLGELPPGTVVSDTAPDDPEEGQCWYDTVRLELFVFAMNAWLPCSPLGARVEQGEILQAQILSRVEAGEAKQTQIEADYLKKSGGTLTGALTLKRTDDDSYWNYIISDTPKAWHSAEVNHGLILRVGTTNSFKQQFKIQGRSNKDLFEIHDDGRAQARLEGNLNVKNELKENGKRVATQDSIADKLGKAEANEVANSFRIKGTGGTYISASGGELGLYHVKYPEAETHAATMGYVDDETAKTKQYVDDAVSSSGGGSFQTKHDGNRFCLGQDVLLSTSIGSGQVAFYNDARFGTTAPQHIRYIGLNIEEFDWDSFIGAGIIRVRNGASDAGFYQVFHKTENAGRNVLIHVAPVWSDQNQVLQADSGTPCYFQGVFFA